MGAIFRYINRDDPNYNPYGTVYTERQNKILSGEIPVDSISTTELTKLRRKAEVIGDLRNAEIAEILYYRKTSPTSYFPPYTMEEAKEILQNLTPWQIKW